MKRTEIAYYTTVTVELALERLSSKLVCPMCKGQLSPIHEGLRCEAEGFVFPIGPEGYLDFVGAHLQGEIMTEEYIESQEVSGLGVFERYVRPWLDREPCHAVLEVGCGIGKGISVLAEEGYEAYGVDLPNLARFWTRVRNDTNRFLCADALRLPFPGESFDAIYSLGVIEHIGTVTGNMLLSEDYQKDRECYGSEILRVLRPGGRVLLSCPHKRFPLDIQHGPGEPASPAGPLRAWLWRKGHVTVHKTWGRHYLPTYPEVERWFLHSAKPLPLKGYFGFSSFEHRALSPFLRIATFYVENLPSFLRRTPLNPYVLAELRKQCPEDT